MAVSKNSFNKKQNYFEKKSNFEGNEIGTGNKMLWRI